MKQHTTVRLLGLELASLSERDAKKRVAAMLKTQRNAKIFTPNPDMLWQVRRDPSLGRLLGSADLLLPDGVGLTIAARLRGTPLKARLTGIDTAEWILRYAAKTGLSVFLLGGKSGVAERAAKNLRARFPDLRICGTHHGYFDKTPNSAENGAVLKKIAQAKPDILFVCFGFPAQERWIAENCHKLPTLRLSMGLGGSLDVWSGNLRRAPRVFQRTGTEWLWRALRQPRRVRALLRGTAFLLFEAINQS